jgi:hypothetical protein
MGGRDPIAMSPDLICVLDTVSGNALALPPTWSKWKCELMMRLIRARSRSIASSLALTSSPGLKPIRNYPARRERSSSMVAEQRLAHRAIILRSEICIETGTLTVPIATVRLRRWSDLDPGAR